MLKIILLNTLELTQVVPESTGSLMILPPNIRLGCKDLSGINALACLSAASVTKKFFLLGSTHGANVIKLFTALSYDFS